LATASGPELSAHRVACASMLAAAVRDGGSVDRHRSRITREPYATGIGGRNARPLYPTLTLVA
jgi:hypothetical protein